MTFYQKTIYSCTRVGDSVSKNIFLLTVMAVSSLGWNVTHANDSVTFSDIAKSDVGIDYRRVESPRTAFLREIQARGFFYPDDGFNNPLKARGAPGVAIFDFDKDGDLDIYVTNGPGKANSLYSSQYKESGSLTFVDVAAAAGVELTDHDNSGVCYGDIDNDGDPDLMVLATADGNSLFENNGNGYFRDITKAAQITGIGLNSTSCSMGDVNGDGLLDIAIANSYDNWNDFGPIVSFAEAFRNQDNQLFVNQGGNVFSDKSVEAGITNYQGISWVVALIDYDVDGDADLVVGDDQGAKPGAIRGGMDTGVIRVYNNDGTGHFTDVTLEAGGTNRFGAWMGFAFADYNSDGHLDIFASNIGDYMARFMEDIVPFEMVVGDWNSAWFLGDGNGKFTFPGVGNLKATPFGWGAVAVDYDNDADTDIIFHGGIDMGSFVEASNPGSVLSNDGNANFEQDIEALANSTNHTRRLVMGVAAGDLNDDGFSDIVSVSAADWPEMFPLAPMIDRPFGGSFDATAHIWPTFVPNDPTDFMKGFTWTGMDPIDGTLAVEINNAENNNHWVKVDAIGSVSITDKGKVNRDGIGAILSFQKKGGRKKEGNTAMKPVVGGASYASQNSLSTIFGLGDDNKGTLDVLWPGGVKNRLYNIHASEHVTIPEIPCSFDDPMSFQEYIVCVDESLEDLHEEGIIDKHFRRRLYSSAVRAYLDAHEHTSMHTNRRESASHEDRGSDREHKND